MTRLGGLGGGASMLSCVLACGSPGGTGQPTRTPHAGRLALGVAEEEPLAARNPHPEPSRGRIEDTARTVARWIPRTRPSVHFAPTERIAVGLQGNVAFSLQAWGAWNVVRTRRVDLTGRLGAGYEQCAIVGSRLCDLEPLPDFVFHTEALASVGVNPTARTTIQVTAGPMLQRGRDSRVLLFAEANAYFFLNPTLGLGPSVLVLPRWLPDGRWVVAPALSLLVYLPGANPYL